MYSSLSQYSKTKVNSFHLDLYNPKKINIDSNDKTYIIESKYHLRPDKLAYDLYGSPDLWWVFIVSNMNIIKDPLYDFRTGLEIVVPNKNKVIR